MQHSSYYNSTVGKDNLTQPLRAGAGFTLIEAVVAISILMLVISGIMNVIYQGSNTVRQNKDRLTATHLAADSIEFIRADRDSHWLATEDETDPNRFQGWATSSLVADCDEGTWCQVDTRPDTESFSVCGSSAADCDLLDYNTQSGLYGHESGVGWGESKFTRSFTIATDDLDAETDGSESIKITSQVTWPRSTGEVSTASLTEHLYGWRYASGEPTADSIVAGLQESMSTAQSYYDSNSDSYEGLCADSGIQQAVSDLQAASDGAACWEVSENFTSSDDQFELVTVDYGIAVKFEDGYYVGSPLGVGIVDDEDSLSGDTTDWDTAVQTCSNADGSLASPSSLRAMYSIGGTAPLEEAGFTATGATGYWSALESPSEETDAYRSFFHNGYVSRYDKSDNRHVRCVQ